MYHTARKNSSWVGCKVSSLAESGSPIAEDITSDDLVSILIASVLTESLQVHGINNAYKVSQDGYLLLSRTDTV